MNYQYLLQIILLASGLVNLDASPSKGRISNGWKASPHEFPYHVFVLIGKGGGHMSWCGGAIIDENWVVSAEHCYKHDSYSFRHIIAGYVNYKHAKETGGVIVDIDEVYSYSDDHEGDHDIALVKLKKPIKESDTVKYAQLPQKDDVFEGEVGIITGHGKTTESSKPTEYLMYTELKVDEDCNRENFLCTSEIHKESGTCKGDSGGPLVLKGTNILMGGLFGGTSGCGIKDKTSYFSDIRIYLDWISETTGINA